MATVPLRRWGEASEVAGVFLASDASYMTGAHISVDGGLSLARPRVFPAQGVARARPVDVDNGHGAFVGLSERHLWTAEEKLQMKYMLMFCATADGQKEWEELPQQAKEEGYARIGQWFGANADKLVTTHELEGPQTAATVRFKDGLPVVTDGPFIEAKEVIGGYAIVEVADREAAVEMAKGWPAQGTVEVRPVIDR